MYDKRSLCTYTHLNGLGKQHLLGNDSLLGMQASVTTCLKVLNGSPLLLLKKLSAYEN